MIAALALIACLLVLPLPAVCAYGPLENRFLVWRSSRRPVRIAQYTSYGWAEVVPGGTLPDQA